MHSISKIAKRFGLSRSTLLYYDRLGLLQPEREAANSYRVYSDTDVERLEHICLLRSTGLSLNRIGEILAGESDSTALLKERLSGLNDEINALREQQHIIIDLLGEDALRQSARVLTKSDWSAMLRRAGLDEEGMWLWHAAFEKKSPEAHADFLKSLQLSDAEIVEIRKKAKTL